MGSRHYLDQPPCLSTPPPLAPPMANPATPSAHLVSTPRCVGRLVANDASETTKNTRTVSTRRSLEIWEPRRWRRIPGVCARPHSRKAARSTLPWMALALQRPDLQTTPPLLQQPKKQKLRKTFLTGSVGCWSGKRKTRRRRRRKKLKTETLASYQEPHYIPHMSTWHMTPILVSPAGVQPQTSVPPLIQIWQMQMTTLPAIEEQKSPQLSRVGPLWREHQDLQLKRLLQR